MMAQRDAAVEGVNADARHGGAGFGGLLRRHRLAAGLTQEELALRAGMSVRGISDLERGRRTSPQRETLRLLGDALRLSDDDRAAFAAARRVHRSRAHTRPRMAGDPLEGGRFWHATQPLVGRTTELAEIDAIMRAGCHRLLTLIGPPGVGKTRLALAAAARLGDRFPDGPVFVDLAPLPEPALVLPCIAVALGVGELPGSSLIDRVAAFLAERCGLVILDNFEHLLDAAPLLPALLRAGPGSALLATSREPLRLRGERTYPVRPLPLPDLGRPADARTVAQNAAVTLFVERARAVHPAFHLTDDNATAVVEICVRLDGLPLAIELAAPWLRRLSPEALALRLAHRLPLLTGGARDAPARQQTLDNAVAWSYDRLSPEEQRFFRRLAVFAGGFTLEAAEAVSRAVEQSGSREESRESSRVSGGASSGSRQAEAPPPDPPPPTPLPPSVLDLLAALVDKQLVQLDSRGPVPTYGMLATIFEFAGGRLAASGEEPAVHRRHLDYYLGLAEEAEAHLIGGVDAGWINRVEAEHDNVRAALAWALTPERDPADRHRGLRMAGALWLFWYYHSHLNEGRHWLEQALAVAEAGPGTDPARAKALAGLGALAHFQGEDAVAIPRLEEGIRLWRSLGDPVGLAYALTVRGNVAEDSGGYAEAGRLFVEARDLFALVDDRVNVAVTLYHLGVVAYGQADPAGAARLCAEALALARQAADPWTTAAAQAYLGLIYADTGDFPRAAGALAEALALYQEIGTAERIAEAIRRTAVLAEAAGLPERALRLLAAADVIAGRIGAALALPERAAYERARTNAGRSLGATDRQKATAADAVSIEEAAAEAFATLDQIARLAPRPPEERTRRAALTPRERAVLRLLAEGLSDKEIAAALGIARHTASNHVTAIRTKLGAHSRAAAAALAVRNGLA